MYTDKIARLPITGSLHHYTTTPPHHHYTTANPKLTVPHHSQKKQESRASCKGRGIPRNQDMDPRRTTRKSRSRPPLGHKTGGEHPTTLCGGKEPSIHPPLPSSRQFQTGALALRTSSCRTASPLTMRTAPAANRSLSSGISSGCLSPIITSWSLPLKRYST